MNLSLKKVYCNNGKASSKPAHKAGILEQTTVIENALLALLEQRLEKAILRTVLDSNYGILGDKMSTSGHKYENQVINALKEAKVSGLINEGAGSNSASADADINLFGKIFNIEVKLNANAQMGGSSIRLNKNGSFSLASKVNENTEKLLLLAVEKKRQDIEKLLNFVSEKTGKTINKFPFTCKKSIWENAQKSSCLVNVKVPLDTSFIVEHYAKKNINYIQIGGAGLFYLNANPAKLPIPKLDGNIVVEIRTGRSGSRYVKSLDEKVVAGGIRVQGRLKTKNKSPYSIDTPEGVQKLLEAIKNPS